MSFNSKTVNVTEHARQRYVERIKGLEARNDIARWSVQNQEKIDGDLRKMLEYGEEIYFGETIAGKNERKNTHVMLCGSWILLVSADNALVTLFKKDFGFEDEAFNKAYVERVLEEIKQLNEKIAEAGAKRQGQREGLQSDIAETEAQVDDLKRRIKVLEQENEARKGLLLTVDTDVREAQNELKDFVSKIVGTRIFG